MSDNLIMQNLGNSLSNLGVNKSSQASLIDDPIFSIFHTALREEYSDLRERWQETFQLQIYPDPVEYLAPVDGFGEHFHKGEPGKYIDYKQMRETLGELQNFIAGDKMVVLEMYDLMNKLTGAHVEYVWSSIALAGWSLYSKMLDRFYAIIYDPGFDDFVKDTIDITSVAHWPIYEEIHNTIQTRIQDAQCSIKRSSKDLIRFKKSKDLRLFTTRIEQAACLRREKEQTMNQATDIAAERILARHIGKRTQAERAERAKRKFCVALRNTSAQQARVQKNSDMRRRNRSNIHQLGNMARTPLGESVIRALGGIQETYKDTLFEEDDPSKDQNKQTVVQTGHANGVDATNIHLAMQSMTVEDIEALEQKMNEQEPLGGVLVGDGFTVLNLFGAHIH